MEPDTMKVFHSTITRNNTNTENKEQYDTSKVFHSNITRENRESDNNLYDLIYVQSASPKWEINGKENTYCDFIPKTDKYYIPKKRNKIKVRTVRDIRLEYENDVYSYLNSDLEMQQNILLKKITAGSAKDNNTKTLAKNMLKSNNPISRPAWQMLMNLNPEDQTNSIQFVLWNGRRIRVNGSKGGRNKFLCNHDLSTRKTITHNKPKLRKTHLKKIGLLRNSLSVNFKPGPLTKKRTLDDSYQKYNVGDSELINLPRPCLEIQPTLGVPLEPTVLNFLNSYRSLEGTICEKWAELSVSVLGLKDTEACENNSQPIAFELQYTANQKRILMRHDIDDICFNHGQIADYSSDKKNCQDDTTVVQSLMDAILESVVINIHQDEMYTGPDEPRAAPPEDSSSTNKSIVVTKEKTKRKLNELDRLDVTIIRIPEGSEDDKNVNCQNDFCALGCVCNSLRSDYKFKEHCGHIECMFECKCDFTKYKDMNSIESLLPGLINLNEEINLKLAKEEQKFHQTVVVTKEKSILLKSEKRNWKASKRYSEFYRGMNLRTDMKTEPQLSIVDFKLNCDNVEPWCMVHCLYKCFCKGKFVDTPDKSEPVKKEMQTADIRPKSIPDKLESAKKDVQATPIENIKPDTRSYTHPSKTVETRYKKLSECEETLDEISFCARVEPYVGRKYKDSYYQTTNKKILEMERNDDNLHKKMVTLVYKSDGHISDTAESNTSLTSDSVKSSASKNNEELNSSVTAQNNAESNASLTSDLVKSSASNKNEELNSSVTAQNNAESNASLTSDLVKSSASNNNEELNSSVTAQNNIMETSPTKNAEEIQSNSSKKVETQTNKSNVTNAVHKSLLIKNKLMAWVEIGYKQYKQRFKCGNNKLFLDPPKPGKLALYPCEFILSRYRERKNLFLITKQQPMRIFMAVDVKNSFFDNCINIDHIRFADLHKYPETIKNLLTNVNNLRNTFFIMCGLSLCWEIIGSVTKVDNLDDNPQPSSTLNTEQDILSFSGNNEHENTETSEDVSTDNTINDDTYVLNSYDGLEDPAANIDSDISKWFVMTIENDFSEIRFYKRGFFVKYEAIIKAINVARMSNKAVRLSAPTCSDKTSATPFGIYAIPNTREYCVYIGPYENNESLGIETVKSFNSAQKVSKGVWITTKKIDNLKVIDSPLSFMPPANLHPGKIVPLESEGLRESVADVESAKSSNQLSNVENKILKIVKPIKIRKTDGFYHLAPKSMKNVALTLQVPNQAPKRQATSSVKKQPLSTAFNQSVLPSSLPIRPSFASINNKPYSILPNGSSFQPSLLPNDNKKPIAEIAPQIKIVGVYSEAESSTQSNKNSKRPEGGMFSILKPEEINKKVMLNKEFNFGTANTNSIQTQLSSEIEMNQDIENFLATSEICVLHNSDVDMIPVDDDDNIEDSKYRDVWIECLNVDNLGWIRGRRDTENNLGFEFPGFKFTDFYKEEEAFSKINQVLSRKIYIPKTLKPIWHVVEQEVILKTKQMMKPEMFGSDFVLTKKGPCHKRDLIKSSTKRTITDQTPVLINNILQNLEEQSQSLEKEGDKLLHEFKKKGESLRTLCTIPDDQREHLTESLKNIMSPRQ